MNRSESLLEKLQTQQGAINLSNKNVVKISDELRKLNNIIDRINIQLDKLMSGDFLKNRSRIRELINKVSDLEDRKSKILLKLKV